MKNFLYTIIAIVLAFNLTAAGKTTIVFQVVDSNNNAQPDSVKASLINDKGVEIDSYFSESAAWLDHGYSPLQYTFIDFKITAPQKGAYKVKLSAPGYEDKTLPIIINNKDKRIELKRIKIKRIDNQTKQNDSEKKSEEFLFV